MIGQFSHDGIGWKTRVCHQSLVGFNPSIVSQVGQVRSVYCYVSMLEVGLSVSFPTISQILQPYNIRVAHKPATTLWYLLTNVKDREEPNNRQGAVYKIKCSNCQASYIGETGRNLNTRLTEHKRTTRNGDASNHIAVLSSTDKPQHWLGLCSVLNLQYSLFSTETKPTNKLLTDWLNNTRT